MIGRTASHRLYLFLLLVSTVFVFGYLMVYQAQYDPAAPFSLFNPKRRQSEGPSLVGYLQKDYSVVDNQSVTDNDHIYILAWTKVFDKRWPQRIVENCDLAPQARCRLIDDRSYIDRSAAVLFHARDIVHTDLPSVKYRNQKYVFYSAESPVLTFAALEGASRTFFDWAMTYRTDSHIYCPYTYFEPLNSTARKSYSSDWSDNELGSALKENATVPLEKRSKMVLWIASNCDTHSKRERYVHELKKYVSVDIFGDCGRKCEENKTYDCFQKLLKEYKFYISFENAVCRDYVSEKFGYRMASNIVPIVLRREDYDRIVPAESLVSSDVQYAADLRNNRSRHFFIAADDFNNPKELADYLLYLNSHPKEYLKYFDWRKKWRIVSTGSRYCYCDLCAKLYQDRERWRRIAAKENFSVVESMMMREEDEDSNFDIHQWWNANTCDRGMALKLLDPGRRVPRGGY